LSEVIPPDKSELRPAKANVRARKNGREVVVKSLPAESFFGICCGAQSNLPQCPRETERSFGTRAVSPNRYFEFHNGRPDGTKYMGKFGHQMDGGLALDTRLFPAILKAG
jgi:hypothetical protein